MSNLIKKSWTVSNGHETGCNCKNGTVNVRGFIKGVKVRSILRGILFLKILFSLVNPISHKCLQHEHVFVSLAPKAPLNTKLTLMDCGIGNTNLLGSSSSGLGYDCF